MQRLHIGRFSVSVSSAKSDTIVYLFGDGAQAEQLAERIGDATIAAIDGVDWYHDLTPWPSRAIFPGQNDFGGGSQACLEELTQEIVPFVERELEIAPARRLLAGYSLAGMFAVFAGLNSDCFHGVASVSGSLWYPGFAEYAAHGDFRPRCAYFSVGDREKNGRNPAFHTIEEDTQRISEHLRACGVQTTFERNSGGHFVDPTGRMAKGIKWLLHAASVEKGGMIL